MRYKFLRFSYYLHMVQSLNNFKTYPNSFVSEPKLISLNNQQLKKSTSTLHTWKKLSIVSTRCLRKNPAVILKPNYRIFVKNSNLLPALTYNNNFSSLNRNRKYQNIFTTYPLVTVLPYWNLLQPFLFLWSLTITQAKLISVIFFNIVTTIYFHRKFNLTTSPSLSVNSATLLLLSNETKYL